MEAAGKDALFLEEGYKQRQYHFVSAHTLQSWSLELCKEVCSAPLWAHGEAWGRMVSPLIGVFCR